MSNLYLDNFTGADATDIVASHTPDAGAYKFAVAASGGGTFRIKTNMGAMNIAGGGPGVILIGRNNANVDLGVAEYDVTLNFHNYDNANGEAYELRAQMEPGSSNYYRIIISASGVHVITNPSWDFGTTSYTQWSVGSNHAITVHVRDASLKIDLDGVEIFTTTTHLIGSSIGTNDYAALTSTFAFGGGQGLNIDSISLDTPTTVLSAPTAAIINGTLAGWESTVSSVAPTGVGLFCPTPTTGTPGYTYQWYVSTSTGFTPGVGNIVSGATNQIQAITGLTPGTTYYAKCIVTDAVPNTATTAQVTFTTGSAYAAGVSIYVTIGDSTGTSRAAAAKTSIDTDRSRADTVNLCCALSGKASADFVSGNSNNWLKYACAIAKAHGATAINSIIGINDPDAATFNPNLDNIAAYVTGQSLILIAHYVIFDNRDGATGSDANVQNVLMNAHIDSIVNGATIRKGAKQSYNYLSHHTSEMESNGVHLTPTGYTHLGVFEGRAFGWAMGQITPTLTLGSPTGNVYPITGAFTGWDDGTPGHPTLTISTGSISAQTLPAFDGAGSITTTQTSFTVTDPDSGATGSFAATHAIPLVTRPFQQPVSGNHPIFS